MNGGLDMAVHMAIPDTRTVWVSDVEPGPNKILAKRFPDAPNLGDITRIDWDQVEPVDILVGGSPCTDLSAAGQRAGMRPGTRSGLWESMMHAVDALRPKLVIWENVYGALSARAFSLMDSEQGHLGDESGGPVLRALGRVLGDLANLGYDARWTSVRAADVGAPHGRRRVFVIAYPTGDGRERGFTGGPLSELPPTESNEPLLPTPTVGDKGGTEARSGEGFGAPLGEVARLLSTPQARDGKGVPGDGYNLASLPRDVALLRTPCAAEAEGGPLHPEVAKARNQTLRLTGQVLAATGNLADSSGNTDNSWGEYSPAIRRWEYILGREAPAPATLSAHGKPRLSPAFVEWMMGLPKGWVTDVDISRANHLRALGNGVVPQQGAAAITHLLGRKEAA